jgi:hypothetical protein
MQSPSVRLCPGGQPVRSCAFAGALLVCLLWPLAVWGQNPKLPDSDSTQKEQSASETKRRLIWEGDRVSDWTITEFGSQREVKQQEDGFEIEAGYPLSGVHSTAKDWPRENYELEWEFQRVAGNDFPCCLTFPIQDAHCSVVVGGWGGTLVGLSCIDGQDAAHNDTAKHLVFENGKWYRAKLRVTPDQIRFWIDDQPVISQDIREHQLSVRNEVQLSTPLGICSFETTARIRKFRLYELEAAKQQER